MPTTELLLAQPTYRYRSRMNSEAVLDSLRAMCSVLLAGDVVPTHTELMQRFEASERTILWALNELRREGKIVRRAGAKTVVAHETGGHGERFTAGSARGGGLNGVQGESQSATDTVEPVVRSQSVVAIIQPDGSIYDQALRTLVDQGQAANLSINCRPMNVFEDEAFNASSGPDRPLGYILFGKHFAPLAHRLQTQGNHVVLIGGQDADAKRPVPNIYMGPDEGGLLLFRYLIGLGHRRILVHHRWAGVPEALAEALGRGIKVETIFLSDETIADWARDAVAVATYFATPDAPTAIVAWNDQHALVLMTLLQRAGLRVPEDVSLMGYDNLTQGASMHPALTTMDSAIEFQVSLGLHMLLRPEAVAPSQMVVVNPTLVVRDSCGPPKIPAKEANNRAQGAQPATN